MLRWRLAAVLLAVLPGSGSAAPPMRVMSIAQCTDQLVLALLPSVRIASVTWLSRDPASSVMAAAARRVDVNHGLAEDVVRQHPDLVVADSFATPATRALLKRLGYPLIEIDEARSLADIRGATRRLAAAVGERVRGEVLLARMDRAFAMLAAAPVPAVRVAVWDGGGFGAARGSLYDLVLRAAGVTNVADDLPARGGSADAETLLATSPALLLQGAATSGPSLRDAVAQAPVVRRFWGADRIVRVPGAWTMCGTPFLGDAAWALRRKVAAAAARARSPLPFRVR